MKSLMCDADLNQLSGGVGVLRYFRKFDYEASKGYYLQIVIAKGDNGTVVG